mmetsp:Transcript_14262/g.14079  ORF Transcript_14262/g.14079 Transcript_14262/m.14079 type:complete len:87 (+) Transcript_14262:85-345(+)
MDPSKKQSLNWSKKTVYDIECEMKYLEESTQWANLTESYISSILKEAIQQDLLDSDAPLVLRDYCVQSGGQKFTILLRRTSSTCLI